MRFIISLCVSLLLLVNGEIVSGQTSVPTASSSDPCYNYTTLDDYWRDIRQYHYYGYNDTLVEWSGWYRLYLNGESAQMSEWCVSNVGCGGETGLYLNDSHPTLEDGVVTREVVGTYLWQWWEYSNQCGAYTSTSIQVKACAGDYYIYEFVKPNISAPSPTYCAVSFSNISSDPCYNYESLDRPWRATNESGDYICDEHFSWNGWYRLFYNGMNIQMSETCSSSYSCNTYYSLWLNGPHPEIEDGVVTREVCAGSYWSGCCNYKSNPIRVKACPGNYYVYELVKSQFWCSGYCTDVSTISRPVFTVSPDIITGSSITLNYDPCNNYNIQDNHWRSTLNYWSMYGYISDHDDTRVEWDGWYRLFINGSSAQMPEWCMSYMSCGGYSSLWLGGSHPQLEDGVVTREIYGSRHDQCSRYRSEPIQVKACPGDYYVYKFTRPTVSIPAPVYCAVPFSTLSVDPCYNYTSLDESWRATDNYYYNNYYYYGMCDYNVEWNGWYRLFYNSQNTQMPESCVNQYMCGTYEPLWLNGPHPQLEDGVVTRQVCVSSWNGCCTYTSHPIRVKACPGNYYVYEFVKPTFCSAYCADVRSLNETSASDSCSELSCTEDEWCGEKNGVYGCLCNENQTRPDSFDFSETCESSSGSMSVSRCQLFEAGFPADVLHLNDPSCKGTVRNGRVEFHFDNDEHICGTNLVANGTHFIYSNFILGTPRSEGLISREKILKLPFSCVYPQTQSLSMNVEINSLESIVHKILPAGEGRYQVRMTPYEDDEFTRPFTGRVDAELEQKMNVEVRVEGVDSRQFALVMDTCWATPVNDPDYSLRWDLIATECPNPNDDSVELLQNGVSTSSRFSFRMFIFTENSTKLYLHCAVHLCLLSSNRCSTDCNSGHHRRERRSLDFHHSASISMGPLMLSDRNADKWVPEQVKVSEASCLCASLMLLLVPLMSVLTLF
ncbi:pancreatic secretory granule membrane major glycoprotein GP2-like isoform X2 [Onychostoma macrolepis]|uniref:pancreatic secretory granule membrane major glycoprotein GP2-like isoform X2 n=1 Tax=Onychostoma macrolepis TaxID=369639 RepID=UPI00272B2215|nr:pancreatic secretory granule membrane major glycoprotein GP2-like isoform X2 [Onychostoma macrolepis]